MQPWRKHFLLLYMMRVPLLFVTILGFGLPWAFQTSMFHGIADLTLYQVGEAALLAFLLVSSAMTGCFLVLLYGQERADGWITQPAPQDRVSLWSIGLLYVYGGICYVLFLVSIGKFMSEAGRVEDNLAARIFLYSLAGLFVGLLVVLFFFLAALRFAKPEDDDALEVFAFPAFLIIRKLFGGAWIRAFKRGTRSQVASGTYAAHDGRFSRFFAVLLGPGYRTEATPGRPAALHSGHRFATIVMLIFLLAYWLSGVGTLRQLSDLRPWSSGAAPNAVLTYLLFLLIFWSCLLTGLTFFVDRFRFPVSAGLAIVLFFISLFGSSDHLFSTVERTKTGGEPLTPKEAFQRTPESVIVVAAAGGGIQSAAWTSRVLCALRSDLRNDGFQEKVLAISSVSGGSVGTMFYLRCLEGAKDDEQPAKWAQDSSLEAIAWGLTHPDLRRIFIPGPATQWSKADRGWALERSLLKSARFQSTERRLAGPHSNWPVVLLNSTDALAGDPVVFTNSEFSNQDKRGSTSSHCLRSFHQLYQGKDLLLETAARMSAAFPYVSPEARPDAPTDGTHLGDGGYFDNSGVFTLSEWLKEAATLPNPQALSSSSPAGARKRILILQLDAFPDSTPKDDGKDKKWYYQLISPIGTILKVRSEGQLVRDETAGEDLQKLLNGSGYETTWLLVRYAPSTLNSAEKSIQCSLDPPLSWHLTLNEQRCIDGAWTKIREKTAQEIETFLKGATVFPDGECDLKEREVAPGVFERRCPARPLNDKR